MFKPFNYLIFLIPMGLFCNSVSDQAEIKEEKFYQCEKQEVCDSESLRILNICPDCEKEYLIRCKNPQCPKNKK